MNSDIERVESLVNKRQGLTLSTVLVQICLLFGVGTDAFATQIWWYGNIGNNGPGPGGGYTQPGDACTACLQASGGCQWTGVIVGLPPAPQGCQFTCTRGSYTWGGDYGCTLSTFSCPEETAWNESVGACIHYIDRYHDKPNTCSANPQFGHPIRPLTGSKALNEGLGSWRIGGKNVAAAYDTRRKTPANDVTLIFNAALAPSFGELWSSNLHKSLVFQTDTAGVKLAIQVSRGAGAWVSFVRDGSGNYVPDADVSDRLVPTSSGWRYIDATARSEETYDAQGKLLSVSDASGTNLGYTYSNASTPIAVATVPGLLLAVRDQQGRSVQFQYEQPGVGLPRIKQITDPAGQTTAVAYDAIGNLQQFTWPDGKTRQYLYERSDIPWAVTGILDENASRLATYGYDAQGRANDTQWAGGADHYSASYTTPPSWNIVETYDSTANVIWRDHYWQLPEGTTITRPNGSTSSVSVTLVQGSPRLTSQSQPAGSGCSASSSALTYDANGNVASADDFNAHRTCYVSDLTRNLETARVEGLPNTQACTTVTPPNATLPANSRKTSTEWHPDWRLAIKVAEPGKFTTYVYNGQPDPLSGGAIASCAPSTALLPDGEPIAVLCKQVEQATTDADGHLGFTAALQVGVPKREQKWTYNDFGQVLTHDGPRTDMADITTYAYYDDTATDHTMGDLKSVTNALGQVTNYTKYNPHGQLLEFIDPNGVVTTQTYDLRQRLLSTSVNGHTTSYTYDAAGQLLKVTAPDASWVGYEYDPAHRLVATKDNLGNRIDYTLDNAGNRTAEAVKDPGGALRRQLSRSIDALGRIQQIIGRE